MNLETITVLEYSFFQKTDFCRVSSYNCLSFELSNLIVGGDDRKAWNEQLGSSGLLLDDGHGRLHPAGELALQGMR